MKDLESLLPEAITEYEVPCPEYANMKAGAVKFRIRHFWVDGLGNISYMCGKAPLSLMKIESLIINPTLVDMPLLSLDTMTVLGKKLLVLELYKTTLQAFNPDVYKAIIAELGPSEEQKDKPWYEYLSLMLFKKTLDKNLAAKADGTVSKFISEYMKQCSSMAILSEEERIEKVRLGKEYSDGLLEHGGPSTDFFLKNVGREKTTALFHDVLF